LVSWVATDGLGDWFTALVDRFDLEVEAGVRFGGDLPAFQPGELLDLQGRDRLNE